MPKPHPHPTWKDAYWLAVCVGLGLAFGLSPWIRTWDLAGLDLDIRLHRALGPAALAGPEVTVVGIDSETGRRLAEPRALYHRPLGRFLEALAEAGPAAVGVDLILPERSWDAQAPGADAALMRGILRLRQSAPLVLGRTVGQDGAPRPLHAPFETVAGPEGTGFVQVRIDADHVVRQFETHLGEARQSVPTFAGRLAEACGHPARSGLVNFNLGPAFEYVPFQQVLNWQERGDYESLGQAFAGKVVLLGSVAPFEDRVQLPVRLAGWEPAATRDSPAVLLQAQILRTLLAEALIRPLPAWASPLLSILGALAGMALAKSQRKALGPLVAVHLLLPGAAFLLLGLGWALPFAGVLGALDLAFALTAQRQARLRLQAEAQERRLLERALLETAERERRGLGHDLHDGVCQHLSAALLHGNLAKSALNRREAPETKHLQTIVDCLDNALQETHDLAQGLSPAGLEAGGLSQALAALAQRTGNGHRTACAWSQTGQVPPLDGDAATQVYRIAQEGVSNALKHGAPEHIWIHLQAAADSLLLTVDNDGRNLTTALRPSGPGGMGQRILRYRAELLGASLTLADRPEGGTRLQCRLPLRKSPPA